MESRRFYQNYGTRKGSTQIFQICLSRRSYTEYEERYVFLGLQAIEIRKRNAYAYMILLYSMGFSQVPFWAESRFMFRESLPVRLRCGRSQIFGEISRWLSTQTGLRSLFFRGWSGFTCPPFTCSIDMTSLVTTFERLKHFPVLVEMHCIVTVYTVYSVIGYLPVLHTAEILFRILLCAARLLY